MYDRTQVKAATGAIRAAMESRDVFLDFRNNFKPNNSQLAAFVQALEEIPEPRTSVEDDRLLALMSQIHAHAAGRFKGMVEAGDSPRDVAARG